MSNLSPSSSQVQQESVQFNNPVSESSAAAIGGVCNYMLQGGALPLGSIVDSMLTTAQFQAQFGNPSPATWVLADGSDVTGSAYQILTGNTLIPDLRAVFTRGKDNGRGLDPNGDLPLGTYVNDAVGPHQHISLGVGVSFTPQFGSTTGPLPFTQMQSSNESFTSPVPFTSQPIAPNGAETAPKYVVVNKFIRIN